MRKENTEMFLTVDDFLTRADVDPKEFLHIMSQYFKDLANNFDHYFPDH